MSVAMTVKTPGKSIRRHRAVSSSPLAYEDLVEGIKKNVMVENRIPDRLV